MFCAMRRGHLVPPFSCMVFGRIAAQWGAWENGIPPTAQPTGHAAQNPRLLAAFEALARARSRASESR